MNICQKEKNNSSVDNKNMMNNLTKSLEIFDFRGEENSEIHNPDNSRTLDSPFLLESKVKRLQQEIGKKVHHESVLEDKIKNLNIEIKGLKKLLDDNHYYTDLKHSISNISEAIFNTSKNINLKGEHQLLLKNLLGESLGEKIDNLEEKVKNLGENMGNLRQKMKEEVKRSHESYGLARKYISTIKTSHKLLKDYVDISSFIENVNMETDDDLDKIQEMQLKSTQNNALIRSFSEENLNSISKNQTEILQKELMKKEKLINRLEHELKIMSTSKRRTANKFRKLRSGSSHLGLDQENYDDDKISVLSTNQVLKIPSLIEKSRTQQI